MISGATYVGVPQTVYSGPSTTVAKPKSPSFNDLVPSGYSQTCGIQIHEIFPGCTQRLQSEEVNSSTGLFYEPDNHVSK